MKFRITSNACDSLSRIIKQMVFGLALSTGISVPVYGQINPPSSVRCPSPADPYKSQFECAGESFDFIEETLTKDWAGLRREFHRLGITPTASYTMQLMGNPSGGQSRGFTYAGTLQTSIFWDLEKLLRLPGLSFDIGGAWSTGKDLSADYIGNSFTVQSAYTARTTVRIILRWARYTYSSDCLSTHS